MSRIEAIDGFFLERPPDVPGQRAEHCFLLRLRTEDGREGWGEAHGSPFLLRAAVDAPFTHPSAQGLRHLLRGVDSSDVPAARRQMERGTQWIGRDGTVAQAVAAAEAALWDLAGQRAGLPVWRLLAPHGARTVQAYASGKAGPTPEAAHARLRRELAEGHEAFKIGWPPFGADEATDRAFLEAARDAVGGRTLMVDAAQAWDGPTAAARLTNLASFRLAWMEEPLDRDDLAGQATLRAASPVPVAAGEGECGLRGLLALLEGGCVDVLQPDATRCGMLAALTAARAARARGLGVASHSFTTGLNVLMHAHLLSALDAEDAWLEWPVGQLALWAELFPDAPHHVGGRVAVPEAPGWGMRPDPSVLRRLCVMEEAAA